jgi:O-antigen ligase
MQFGPVLPAVSTAPRLDFASAAVYIAFFAIIAYATYRRPAAGVLALIFCDPFAFYRSIGFTTLTLSKVALIAIVIGFLLRKMLLPAVLLMRPAKSLLLATTLVTAAVALSMWHASAVAPAARETLKWLEYAAIFAVCAAAYYNDPDETLVRWGVLITTALVSALAIPELFTGASSGIIVARTEVPRIAGPLEGPNQLAAYLGLMLPVILAYTLKQGRRWPEIFTIAAGIVATLLSFSRGGIVSLLLALFLVAILCTQSKLAKSIFAAAAIVLLIASAAAWRLVAGGIGLVTASAHHHIEIRGGLGTRRDLWAAAVSLWRAHPLWGIGAGNYELEVGKLLRAPIKTHANSFYLQSLVEGGLPLLGATVFLIYNSIAAFWGRARTPLTIAALAGSTALALHFILDLLVFYPKVGMQWMILLGIASADLARSKDHAAS